MYSDSEVLAQTIVHRFLQLYKSLPMAPEEADHVGRKMYFGGFVLHAKSCGPNQLVTSHMFEMASNHHFADFAGAPRGSKAVFLLEGSAVQGSQAARGQKTGDFLGEVRRTVFGPRMKCRKHEAFDALCFDTEYDVCRMYCVCKNICSKALCKRFEIYNRFREKGPNSRPFEI